MYIGCALLACTCIQFNPTFDFRRYSYQMI